MLLQTMILNFLVSLAVALSNTSQNDTHVSLIPNTTQQIPWVFSVVRSIGILFGFSILAACCGVCVYKKTNMWHALENLDLMSVKNTLYWNTINCKNHNGLTPLHCTMREFEVNPSEAFKIIRFLLHENAATNIEDDDKRTVIDYALEEQNRVVLLCLLLHGATEYDVHSKFLSDETKKIFASFRLYHCNRTKTEKDLFTLLSAKEIKSLGYLEKKYDALGFALRNNDYRGLKYLVQHNECTHHDILMAIADNKQMTKFLSYALASIPLENHSLKAVLDYAQQQDNPNFKQALKKYAAYMKALRTTTLYKKIGEPIVMKKILSYVDCSLE